MNHSEQNTNQTTDAQSIPKSTNKNVIIGLAIGAVAIIIIFLAAIFMAPKKINLNDYVSVEFTGYNSMGNAYVTFDNAAFHADYDEEMKFTKEAVSSGYTEVYELFGVTPAGACLDSIDVSLSQSSDLSNGMTVTLVWNCDDSLIEEMFNCVVVYEPTDYTVEGLSDITMFDPFENLEVTFDGISPEGTVTLSAIDNTGVFQEMKFVSETTNHLSNGDVITISLGGVEDPITYCAENFGCCPSVTEKEITVEGLNEYMTSLEQLSQEAIDAMTAQAIDVLNARVASTWRDDSVVNEISCAGFYLLTPKDGVTLYGSDKNGYLYLVLKFNATIGFRKGFFNDASEFVPMELYYPVGFIIPIIDGDGNCVVNTGDYTQCVHSTTLELDGYNDEHVSGYETITDFFNDKIQTELADFHYETNIE